ncbi:unnamed protein product [Cladocopium goreaui]|uniref:Protein-S-isoprenylcysteine O-methyltransferase n=1 Tax=Cladocopium goreaui TaxID=2562237 RepID=A0A9P1CRN1_9DINO|nr:unnamed protein product [Cladocopium goreaui]
MLSLDRLDDPGPKGSGRSRSPESGPTPGGNSIQIEEIDRCMQKETITKFFSHEAPEVPLVIVEKTFTDGPCLRSENLSVMITEPGSEEISCSKHESRIEKKGPPGYEESSRVTGDPAAVKAKLIEIATVLEKSERGSGKSGEEVETFLLEQLDDAPTEVMDLGLGAQREVAPLEDVLEESFPTASQWQYGRCVALKLVAHSPQGSSAFEQLLSVLLTVFQVTAEERKGSFRSRKSSQSWWRSGLLRCRPADRGQSIPEDDALLPCPMGKKKTSERNGEDELQIGDNVEIFGLQGAKDLNGRTGRIVSFVEETQRFGVKLDDGLENKAVGT